jgi:excisionase family DNA binding protein
VAYTPDQEGATSMARSARDPAAENGRDTDVLTTEELAARLGLDVQTVLELLAAGVLPGQRVGRRWLSSWTAVYTWIAGPGVPDGEILSARQLGHRLGVGERVVRRAAGTPGTPGKLPGRQVGKQWRFAVQAVRMALSQTGGPPDGAAPGSGPRPLSAAGQAGGPPPG